MEKLEEAAEYYRAALLDAFEVFASNNSNGQNEFAVPLNDLLERWPKAENPDFKELMDFDLEIMEIALGKIELEDGLKCFKEKFADTVLYTDDLQRFLDTRKNCLPYIQLQRLANRGKRWLTEALIRISDEAFENNSTRRSDGTIVFLIGNPSL